MPQAIHESTAFNSCNRKVAIYCVFSVKDNTLIRGTFLCLLASVVHTVAKLGKRSKAIAKAAPLLN